MSGWRRARELARADPPLPTPLRRLRVARGHSVVTLAAVAGMHPRTVQRAERGEGLCRMPVDTILRLAGALRVRPIDVLPALGAVPPAPSKRRTGLRGNRRGPIPLAELPANPPGEAPDEGGLTPVPPPG